MDIVSYIDKGRTMVPLRFFSQVLGYDVFWDNDYKLAFLMGEDTWAAAVDKDLTILNSLLAQQSKSADLSKTQKSTLTAKGAVKVVDSINGDKIALSLKFPEENPWLNAADKYAVGNVVTGRVARMTDFGAFVELEPGVDALLHVSQISQEHVEKPSDVLSVGQEITAKVVDFNGEDRKISLSMKALEDNSAEQTEE